MITRHRHGLDLGPWLSAELGGSLAPACGCTPGAERVLEQCRPACCSTTFRLQRLSECAGCAGRSPCHHAYPWRTRHDDAGQAGKALAAALPNSRTVVLRGAGHMMMAERPDELLAALQG